MKTLGERRVRVDFNVSGNSDIDDMKFRAAEAIDCIEEIIKEKAKSVTSLDDKNDMYRLKALAQTAFEEAAIWAVRAITV